MRPTSAWAAVVVTAMLLTPAAGAKPPNTLALEGALVSFGTDWTASDVPAGSTLQHRGEADGEEPGFGLSFELRPFEHVGFRLGFLNSSLPVTARAVCPSTPCTWTSSSATVSSSVPVWSTEGDSDLLIYLLEVPFSVRVGSHAELFAGPSLAVLDTSDVATGGVEGLRVTTDPSSPSYGLHVGGAVHFGRRSRLHPDDFVRPWSVGLIARWLQTELDVSVDQPLLGAVGVGLFQTTADEDLVSVSLVVGRRMGGSD